MTVPSDWMVALLALLAATGGLGAAHDLAEMTTEELFGLYLRLAALAKEAHEQ